jgi:apolipoprotein N-acyltransferase
LSNGICVVKALADLLADLSGWQRYAATFFAGVIAALALPPLYLVPSLVIGFTALAWLFTGVERKRSAFAVGWWFAFGYFAISLYWVGFALLVEADKFAWMLPIATLGLPALLGLFAGSAALLAFLVIRKFSISGFSAVIVLAVSWTFFEWLRGFVLTGFPWNLSGYAWGASDAMAQLASVVGVQGLGLLTFLFAASPAALADQGSRRRQWSPILVSALLLVSIGFWGQTHLLQNPTRFVEGVTLRLVQPAINQKDKWRPELRRTFLQRYMQMSSQAGAGNISLLIWPETAIPYYLDREPGLRRALGQMLPANGYLITGVPRTLAEPRKPGAPFQVWNSIQALNNSGDVVASYDKHHLVPFGEYVPLRQILGMLGIERLAAGRGDFQRGSGPKTLQLPGYPGVGPLICYEVIFPGEVVSQTDRPGWILNVTNDAWFGISAGPWQHLAIARMRAIEEGLPLVRAANSGISAIIDPQGRIIGHLGLGASDVLDGGLPAPMPEATIFARFQDLGLFILMMISTLLVWLPRKSNTASPSK